MKKISLFLCGLGVKRKRGKRYGDMEKKCKKTINYS